MRIFSPEKAFMTRSYDEKLTGWKFSVPALGRYIASNAIPHRSRQDVHVLNRLFGALVRRYIVPFASGLVHAGLTANAVTVLGFCITIAAAVLVATGTLFAGGLVLLAGAGFDMLDGAVARASGGGSPRGAFLDSTLDRLSDAALFLGAFWWLSEQGDTLGVWLTLAAMVLSFMVSYVRARAEGLGFSCRVGIAERPERIIALAAGLLFGLLVPAMALLVVGSAVTVLQRCAHVWKQAAKAPSG